MQTAASEFNQGYSTAVDLNLAWVLTESQRGTQRESRNSREGVKFRQIPKRGRTSKIPKMVLTLFSLLEVLTGNDKRLLSNVLK